MPHALMTTKEVAAALHVSSQTLSRWRKQGLGPRWVQYAERGTVRYPRASVMQYLRDQAARHHDHA